MILIPAYGRDYKTAAEVKKDWEAGKDFMIADVSCRWNGSYTSIRDTEPDCPHRWDIVDKHGIRSYIRYQKHGELTHIGTWEEPETDEFVDESNWDEVLGSDASNV